MTDLHSFLLVSPQSGLDFAQESIEPHNCGVISSSRTLLENPPPIQIPTSTWTIFRYRLSASWGIEAGTAGCTTVNSPPSTYARWLGAKRGASRPSSISRVTAKRSKDVAGRYRRVFGRPSDVPFTLAS